MDEMSILERYVSCVLCQTATKNGVFNFQLPNDHMPGLSSLPSLRFHHFLATLAGHMRIGATEAERGKT
jgi:hypothetical protein